jgi:hypothetical protein
MKRRTAKIATQERSFHDSLTNDLVVACQSPVRGTFNNAPTSKSTRRDAGADSTALIVGCVEFCGRSCYASASPTKSPDADLLTCRLIVIGDGSGTLTPMGSTSYRSTVAYGVSPAVIGHSLLGAVGARDLEVEHDRWPMSARAGLRKWIEIDLGRINLIRSASPRTL